MSVEDQIPIIIITAIASAICTVIIENIVSDWLERRKMREALRNEINVNRSTLKRNKELLKKNLDLLKEDLKRIENGSPDKSKPWSMIHPVVQLQSRMWETVVSRGLLLSVSETLSREMEETYSIMHTFNQSIISRDRFRFTPTTDIAAYVDWYMKIDADLFDWAEKLQKNLKNIEAKLDC